MACTHPFKLERIRKADGTRGVRCPGCGMVAFEGDSFWTTILQGTRAFLGLKARA